MAVETTNEQSTEPVVLPDPKFCPHCGKQAATEIAIDDLLLVDESDDEEAEGQEVECLRVQGGVWDGSDYSFEGDVALWRCGSCGGEFYLGS